MRERTHGQEADWLGRLARGDGSAIVEVYDAHSRRLFNQALCVLRSRSDADDALQSVFLKLASMGPDLLRVRELAPYLHGMVHRECLQMLRRERRHGEVPIDGLLLVSNGVESVDPAQLAELDRKLRGLDPNQREALCLRVWNGMSFREIGKATGVSMFTAASRCRIAMRRLRKEMGAP